jgi:hypothetical protein
MNGLAKNTIFVISMVFACIISTISYADETAPKFDCTLTDQLSANKEPGEAKSTFTKTTPMIYFVCSSSNIQKSQSVKSVWIAADTHNAAPANYKIDEKTIQVPDNFTSDQTFTANFSLSKPNNGWPAGNYHVDLYVNNQLIQSMKFNVT